MTSCAIFIARFEHDCFGELREILRFGPYEPGHAKSLVWQLNECAQAEAADEGYVIVEDEPAPPRVSWSEPPVIDDTCPF